MRKKDCVVRRAAVLIFSGTEKAFRYAAVVIRVRHGGDEGHRDEGRKNSGHPGETH